MGPAGSATHACVECGQVFAVEEMIKHGEAYVCASCKPIFMQKLAEGARIDPAEMRYAGFWVRFGALLVDGIVVGIPIGVVLVLVLLATASRPSANVLPSVFFMASIWVLVARTIIMTVYETLMIGKYGATLGKMACKIRVVTGQNESVSYRRALSRAFCKNIARANIYLELAAFLPAAFDKEKRAAQDFLCNTRVIYK